MLSRGFIRKKKHTHTHTWLTFVLSLLLWNCKSKTVYITLKTKQRQAQTEASLCAFVEVCLIFFFVNKSKFVVEKTQKWLAIQNCDLENKNFHTPAPNLVERNDWRTDCGTVCVRNKTKQKNPQGWNFFPTPGNLLGCKLATE